MHHWYDAPPPAGTGALVAHAQTNGAWVAAGAPLARDEDVARAAQRFADAAGRAGLRACFFAAERILPGFAAVCVGEQPLLDPARWVAETARGRRLREQLRRARAKGVTARRVDPGELRPGAPLRTAADALAADWLRGRRMEPMGFLVALEPFHAPEEHRYVVAERAGRLVAFLSAIPVPARRGWLVEHTIRAPDAPNGTAETLLAALCRDVRGAEFVSLGMAPLAGRGPWWARAAAALGRPLYDFAGLRRFRARLRPDRWEPVYLLHRDRSALRPVMDSLRAFAGGSLARFAARSLLTHPVGPPWALSIVLALWTVVLAGFAAADRAAAFGFDRATLTAWVGFDALLAILLFRFALRPRVTGLLIASALAAADAALSVAHLAHVGLPSATSHVALRAVATAGPVAGALALAWAALLRLRLRRGA